MVRRDELWAIAAAVLAALLFAALLAQVAEEDELRREAYRAVETGADLPGNPYWEAAAGRQALQRRFGR